MNRSPEKITKSDLKNLLLLAKTDVDDFFERKPEYRKLYRGKEVLIALCQGAALHYVDGVNGIKDFDVWFFYPRYSKQLPYRRRGTVDFGPSKFGSSPKDIGFRGRRIDVLMRSDSAFSNGSAVEGLERYLSMPKTSTAKHLARKAVVGLYPESVFGKVLWSKKL
ncbi:MAG TPA: hypothetical protein VJ698_13170 [Noviherbaspirillum sp.]|uniref:hypothetical protein n=1 Tax=Noviherbaspirillum sp. TaxID=1926288 RepID=UPI002B467988|nr:hypothetical protein [Noviherbaspirillum sp.]HJV86419.1 hypothetical protein [Noviherbaspirillum sp.]